MNQYLLTFIAMDVPPLQSVSSRASAAVSRRLLGAEVAGTDVPVGLQSENARLVEIRYKAQTVREAQEAAIDALEATLPTKFQSVRLRRPGVKENLIRGQS